MEKRPRTTRCPTCHHAIDAVDGRVRPSWAPFCSERCKLIDLSRWIGGDHAIAGEPVPPEMLEE
jgi:endogenous inhibitor of DNA gyrase (YacG/DUF329 family)